MSELKLPELGEGIDKVDVSAVLVAVGDIVQRDQPIIEVETEKANLEVPAPAAGEVTEVKVGVGDQINVGQTIMIFVEQKGAAAEIAAVADNGAGKKKAAKAAKSEAAKSEAAKPKAAKDDAAKAPEAETAASEEPHAEPAPDSPGVPEPIVAAQPAASVSTEVLSYPPGKRPEIGIGAPAAPSARALARQIGVDILEVPGTGPGGRISRDDVKAHAKRIISGGGGGGALPAPVMPDFARWGEITHEPMTAVRRATAKAMAVSWNTIPHVTQFDRADITQLESMRKKFNTRPEAEGRKLTMTAIALKMVASVLRQFPKFNASIDVANDTIIHKKYIHVGVAVDTPRGLLVPTLRDVDRKNLLDVAGELNDLASRARERKLSLEEMQGATFTISNLGGLGTTYFSPIVNWPQSAILGVGRGEQQAVYEDGAFRPRLMLPLSVSYDHRLIDGADAARFLRRLAEALEQPLLLLLDD